MHIISALVRYYGGSLALPWWLGSRFSSSFFCPFYCGLLVLTHLSLYYWSLSELETIGITHIIFFVYDLSKPELFMVSWKTFSEYCNSITVSRLFCFYMFQSYVLPVLSSGWKILFWFFSYAVCPMSVQWYLKLTHHFMFLVQALYVWSSEYHQFQWFSASNYF